MWGPPLLGVLDAGLEGLDLGLADSPVLVRDNAILDGVVGLQTAGFLEHPLDMIVVFFLLLGPSMMMRMRRTRLGHNQLFLQAVPILDKDLDMEPPLT